MKPSLVAPKPKTVKDNGKEINEKQIPIIQKKADQETKLGKAIKQNIIKKSLSPEPQSFMKNTCDVFVQTIHHTVNPYMKNRAQTPEPPTFKPKINTKQNKILLENKKNREMKGESIIKKNKISIKLPSFAPEISKKSKQLASELRKVHKFHQTQCRSTDFDFNPIIDSVSIELAKKIYQNKKEPRIVELSHPIEKKIEKKESFDINCTFSPQIHKKDMKAPFLERLNEWYNKKNEKTKSIAEKLQTQSLAECSFKPNVEREAVPISPVKISMISVQKYYEKRSNLFKSQTDKQAKTKVNLKAEKNIKNNITKVNSNISPPTNNKEVAVIKSE